MPKLYKISYFGDSGALNTSYAVCEDYEQAIEIAINEAEDEDLVNSVSFISKEVQISLQVLSPQNEGGQKRTH